MLSQYISYQLHTKKLALTKKKAKNCGTSRSNNNYIMKEKKENHCD